MNGYKIVLLKAIFMLYRLPECERVCSGICTLINTKEVFDPISALDAFELLDDYINPRPKFNMTSAEVKASLSVKQKQDAVSLLKGRALLKLQELYTEQLKQMQYG